ncbi:hypothetical protein SAMN04515667_0115 [Formosa sp. Hel1_31_208]|uniref:hypothetical protein n=1 Tax=Formosa sp. Hel1_31_208 TaxID=1798225 RepID=UPI00087CE938|nr:hypothetical protein [Formosa sp. Hel1_31_208]SDR66450.1 hypothetical protein SAMN04515667_0115 [Formosa sp. Hel1_31_208]
MKSMQQLSKSITLVLISMLLVFSCETDDGPSTPPNQNQGPDPTAFIQNFGSEITRDFLGTIVDTNNNPIENVMVSIGSSSVMTDSNGVFIINNAIVNQRFGYVKADKTGYIHASRAVVPSSGTNKIRIMMLPETVAGTTASGTQETISLGNGASVALEGDYIKPDGTIYSGNVNVIMHHLDPVDEDMPDQMPGMLYAANAQNEERMLQTLGMLAVELRGDGGEDLNLAEGSTAEIRVPVDASLIATAPNTIPLWYFDETNGFWIEEGQATLVGNEYIGNVSHFSFWNCDIPAEAVNLCITASDETGSLLSNLNITLTSNTFGTSSGNTNENGEVCGLVPSNETLELNVYIFDVCGNNSIYTQTIGPFNADSSIGIVIPDNLDIVSETVIGTFNTCNGDSVTDGYVQLGFGNQVFTDAVTDGNFEINLIRCNSSDTFSIEASDFVNLQVTDSINYTFTTPLTDIGTISACNAVTEFIQYTIDDGAESLFIVDGISADFTTSSPNTNGPSLTIFGSQQECFYLFGVLNEAPYVGEYGYLEWNDVTSIGFNISECNNINDNNNGIVFNLTALGDVGEYIDINFSGSYEDFNGNPHTITGIVHVIRDN